MGGIGNSDAAHFNFLLSLREGCLGKNIEDWLLFFKKNIPEEITDKKESENDDRDGNEGKFVERKNENAERPEKSDPYDRIFSIDLPLETEIKVLSQRRENEGEEEKKEEEFRQAEMGGDKCREEHFHREERYETEIADHERF